MITSSGSIFTRGDSLQIPRSMKQGLQSFNQVSSKRGALSKRKGVPGMDSVNRLRDTSNRITSTRGAHNGVNENLYLLSLAQDGDAVAAGAAGLCCAHQPEAARKA